MKHKQKIIDRILAALTPCQSICVVGHIRPDGDCIGSQVGLTMALQNAGKKVTCWNQDPVPAKLGFLDPDKLVQQPRAGSSFDCVIAVDCASHERLGTVGPLIQARKILINIDHHASNTRYGDCNWISPREPSSGELVLKLAKAARWAITPQIADCLFTAISTDTGSFQYASTRPATYHAAAELVKRGANLAKVCNEVYQSYPLSRVRLLRHVYNHFKLIHQNRVAYFWLKKADYERTGAAPNDSEGLIDHIRDIEPVIVACVFEEAEPGVTRISMRSKSQQVNVNAIATQFGGGGHVAAAGARIPGTPLSIQRRVLKAIKQAIDAARD